MAEIKARILSDIPEKSQSEIEAELLAQHEAEKKEIVVEPIVEPTTEPTIDLKDEDVLSFLGKKFNKEVKSFDDLVTEKEILPEDVGAFLKYKKETGRGIEDFIKLNRDFNTMDETTKIREYLAATQEGLDDEDIDAMVADLEADEDLDLESDIRKKKVAKKKTLTEAKKFFEKQQEQYKVPLESSPALLSDEEKNEFESYKQYTKNAKTVEEEQERKRTWFDQKSNELFTGDFKGFEVKLGDKEVKFSPGTPTELKSVQASPMNFINRFLDENGLIKDAEGYHKALSMAMYGEKWLQFAYEQGQADKAEGFMSGIKNINMVERQAPKTVTGGGIKVRILNPD